MWNRALGATELAAVAATHLTGSENGLVANWPLDDGAGQTARDVSPNHLNLQLGSSPQPDLNDPRWARTVILDSGPYYSLQTDHANDLSIDCGASPCVLYSAVAIDFNHDGAIDLLGVTTARNGDFSPTPLVALQNDGSGHFTNVSSTVFTGGAPLVQDVADSNKIVADFNGDGLPDVYLGDGARMNPPGPGRRVGCSSPRPTVISWTRRRVFRRSRRIRSRRRPPIFVMSAQSTSARTCRFPTARCMT